MAAIAGLVATLVYLLLVQPTFYKTDGPDIARLLDAHLQGLPDATWPHPWHVGYLPLLDGCRRLLAGFGVVPDFVQLGGWLSAVGAGIAVGFATATARRLLPPAGAWFAVAAFAASPGMVLFGSVVEFHGPVQAPLAIAAWWLVRQVERPRLLGMLGLAGLCHLAFLVHGQAMFHLAWLLAFFLARRSVAGLQRRDLLLAATAAATHLALWWGMPRLLPDAYGFWADLGRGLQAEGSIGRPQSLDYTPAILWQEWLVPLLPLSVLVPLTACRRGLRRDLAAFAVGFAPYLYLSVRQLVFEPEYGAYLLPMVLPAALLVGRLVGGWWSFVLWVTLPIGLWVSAAPARAHLREQRQADAAFAAAVATAAAGKQPFVLVGSHRELAAAYAGLRVPARRRDPLTDEVFLWVRETATMPAERATPEHFAGIDGYLRLLHGSGRVVLLTEAALQSLDDPRGAMLAEKATLQVEPNDRYAGPRFAALLRDRFVLTPAAPGLLRLVPR